MELILTMNNRPGIEIKDLLLVGYTCLEHIFAQYTVIQNFNLVYCPIITCYSCIHCSAHRGYPSGGLRTVGRQGTIWDRWGTGTPQENLKRKYSISALFNYANAPQMQSLA